MDDRCQQSIEVMRKINVALDTLERAIENVNIIAFYP